MIDTKHLKKILPPSQRAERAARAETGNRDGSRRNALKDGLRARFVFPQKMADEIFVRKIEFATSYVPKGPVEGFLVDDIARSTVQIETCSDLMIVDAERAHLRISNCWADDRRAQAVRLASQLSNDPFRVGNMLEQTRHGTEVKLGCWDNLYSVTETSKAWDEPQRQMAFDLLSVPQVLRNGSGVVPAGDNLPALRVLVARERKRLQTRLDVVLIDRDKAQKEAAELGLPIEPDTATRRLRSAERGRSGGSSGRWTPSRRSARESTRRR